MKNMTKRQIELEMKATELSLLQAKRRVELVDKYLNDLKIEYQSRS